MKSFFAGLSLAKKSQRSSKGVDDTQKWKSINSWEPHSICSSPSPPSLQRMSSSRTRSEGASRQDCRKRFKNSYYPSTHAGRSASTSSRNDWLRVQPDALGPDSSTISFIWPALMSLKSKACPVDPCYKQSSRALNAIQTESQKLAMDMFRTPSDSPVSDGQATSRRRISCGEAIPSPESSNQSLNVSIEMEFSFYKKEDCGDDPQSFANGRRRRSEGHPGAPAAAGDLGPRRRSSNKQSLNVKTSPSLTSETSEQAAEVPLAQCPLGDQQLKNSSGGGASATPSGRTSPAPLSPTPTKSDRKSVLKTHGKKRTSKLDQSEVHQTDVIAMHRSMSEDELNLVTFTVDQQAAIRNYFIMYDADINGALSMSEVMEVWGVMDRVPKRSEDKALLDEIMLRVNEKHDGELQFNEFLRFMQSFYSTMYKRAFIENSGSATKLPHNNLRLALHQLQHSGFALRYEDLELVMQKGEEILWEEPLGEVEEANKDSTYGFTFEQYHRVLELFRQLEFEHLRERSGFDPERVAFIKDLFTEADVDNSGTLEIREVGEQFLKARIPITDVDEFVDLFARMDTDKSASLSFPELLRLMSVYTKNQQRKENEGKHQQLKKEKHPDRCLKNFNKTRTSKFKEKAKEALNDAEDIFKFNQAASQMINNAVIEEVEHGTLAKQWGLSVEDIRSLRESFEFCDVDGSNTIDKGELHSLLNNLGFPLDNCFQKEVFESCLEHFDSDESGLVFIRCVQWILQYFSVLTNACFEHFQEGGVMPRHQVMLAMYQMGQYLVKQKVAHFLHQRGLGEEDDVDLETFLALVNYLRSQSLEQWRQTYGFSTKQVAYFRHMFGVACEARDPSALELTSPVNRDEARDPSALDPLNREKVPLARIQPMLEMLGYVDDDPVHGTGKTLLEAVARVDREESGMLEFGELLLLLRHLENHRVRAMRKDEEQAVKVAGLDSDAVSLFRDLFNSCPKNELGEVSQQDIKIILSKHNVITTQDQRKQLNAILEGQKDTLKFADFLRTLTRVEKELKHD